MSIELVIGIIEKDDEMIRARDLFKTYSLDSTQVSALRGVDLDVRAGEFVAIAGPSGSGKSTLLNLLGCVERPTSGDIFFEERDVMNLSADELADLRARRIGFIFQTFNLLPVLTAYENIEFMLQLNGVAEKERRERVQELLQQVGLASFGPHRPAQLSGGQRQRVAVARAMAANPSLILADEPTANLDHQTGLDILHLLKDMNRKTQVTLVFTTHDPKIMNEADRIIRLEEGRVAS